MALGVLGGPRQLVAWMVQHASLCGDKFMHGPTAGADVHAAKGGGGTLHGEEEVGLGTRINRVGSPPLPGAGGGVAFGLQRGNGEVTQLRYGGVGNPPRAESVIRGRGMSYGLGTSRARGRCGVIGVRRVGPRQVEL